jgi:ABC-2 type transport system ATP-binding protein
MATIEVRGLRKTYGATVAVDTIDLDVAEGEIVGILGPNGSGKTTTVECLAGLRRPDSGTVRVAGFDPAADRGAITKLVGVQLQQAGLQPKLTAREAIELCASFYDDPVDGVALAERLGLGPKLDTRYTDMSGGQQQRLAIALALVGHPRIALLDELTTGLDPRSRRAVWQVIEDAREGGATIVLVTHLMEEARHLCDRVAIIDRGRIAALDTPEGVIGRTGAPTVMSFAPSAPFDAGALETVVGVASARAREDGRIELSLRDESVLDVLAWLSAHDVRPRRLRVVDSTLDDAFLDLTSQGGEDD